MLLFSCQPEPTLPPNPAAQEFLVEVLDIMEANSINRFDIDWVDFRTQVTEEATTRSGFQGAYAGIRLALELLGDQHSFFLTPDGTAYYAPSSLNCSAFVIPPDSLPEDIGYVKIEGFSGPSDGRGLIFAREIEDQIKAADKPGLSGWIVDLRGNTGGNMWPMVAGVGSILGEGIAGYFIGPDSSISSWGYRDGYSFNDQFQVSTLSDPYELISPDPRVAVLTNPEVISSGEALTISFIDRPNTKSFGGPTCGLSTSNQTYALSNGSSLILTTAYMANRNKTLYGVPVEPDVAVDLNSIYEKAVEYLRE